MHYWFTSLQQCAWCRYFLRLCTFTLHELQMYIYITLLENVDLWYTPELMIFFFCWPTVQAKLLCSVFLKDKYVYTFLLSCMKYFYFLINQWLTVSLYKCCVVILSVGKKTILLSLKRTILLRILITQLPASFEHYANVTNSTCINSL